MKKAQVLSAIALAFALGVVAPVATTTVSALEYGATESEGKASQAEVNNAVAYVRNDADYKAMSAVIDAYINYFNNKDTNGNKLYSSYVTSALGRAVSGMSNLGQTITVAGVANVSAPAAVADAQKVLDAITKNVKYIAYTELSKAMNDDDVTRGDLIDAIKGYDSKTGGAKTWLTDTEFNNDTDYPVSRLKSLVNSRVGAGVYEQFDSVAADVEAAQENINKNNAAVAMLKTVLTNDVLSEDGQTALTNADRNGIANDYAYIINRDQPTTSTNISNVANSTYFQTNNFASAVNNLNGWAQLMKVVATTSTTRDDSQTNYTAIANLANYYKGAVKTNQPLTTVLMATMAGYTAPSNPGNNGNTGSDNEGNGSTDPSAPGTGVIANTEGSAATTVSMLAGLATALTALGAGVVAYRNARRANEE